MDSDGKCPIRVFHRLLLIPKYSTSFNFGFTLWLHSVFSPTDVSENSKETNTLSKTIYTNVVYGVQICKCIHERRSNHPLNYVIKMVRFFFSHLFAWLFYDSPVCCSKGRMLHSKIELQISLHNAVAVIVRNKKYTKGFESHTHILGLFNGFDVFMILPSCYSSEISIKKSVLWNMDTQLQKIIRLCLLSFSLFDDKKCAGWTLSTLCIGWHTHAQIYIKRNKDSNCKNRRLIFI